MFEEEQICPYTGLRSFTEEESIYFKGREEEIDKATEQLQRNKFLMLTGASGDGKSSLIYAGIIPNARAGFLKSKYSHWCVADFRPERTPFDNLCNAIAKELGIPNTYSVQAELNHGFSAIIDLYKNSKRFADINSVAWQKADDAGKAAMKREAANLIILVDQFEEFFTNPENYHKGVPSGDANLVLNLLLETARIALEEDLPIYIVFTMRSDYIGQCASFRGLPEYIGFSQFFVPRLNRTQLQQVVEEPSVLSGNKITRRLTERLIHDLKEGVDQLPILQHALNQVWHAADNGKEEMDLVHYAMVGGMPKEELPGEQVHRFEKWFAELPPHIQECYHEPNLQNVLDTHTNKLYEQAANYYTEKTGKQMTDEDAKAIIKNAFICLTKIDQSRAVRNRMTLKEITDILNRPEFGTKEVGAVLDIFREPGNTFIRPFMTEDPSSQELKDSDVLDITHESLIRNWEFLEQWAKEEFDNYTISLDFEQQLNRWVGSGKRNGFLLPIGPLTYFENWFKTAKPNAHWIARYLPEEIEEENKLTNATQVLQNGQEFLHKSAKKQAITRAVMRYGPKRIALVIGLLAIITLSSFAIRNYFRRQDDYVLKQIKARSLEMANDPKLSPEFPIPVLTEQLILGNLSIPEIINGITDTLQKIKTATGIATQLVMQGRYEPRKEILQGLSIADSLLEQVEIKGSSRQLSDALRRINDFKVTAGFAHYCNPDPGLDSLVMRNARRGARWAFAIFEKQPEGFTDIQGLSMALGDGINHAIFNAVEIDKLIKILSPLEDSSRNAWMAKNYERGKLLVRGGRNYGMKFNGLYQDLAYLYAANGDTKKALQCIDTILRYPEGFHVNDYATHIENATNIAPVYYAYGRTNQLDSFVQGYCRKKNTNAIEFYNRLVSRALIDIDAATNPNFYAGGGGQQFSNLNIKLSSDALLAFFFGKLKEEIARTGDNNEKNFNLATVLKNEAQLFGYRATVRGTLAPGNDQLLAEAVKSYQLVSKEYLDQPVTIQGSSFTDNSITMARKFMFLYPDYRVPFHPFEKRNYNLSFHSPVFVKYLLDHGLFDKVYETEADLKYFEIWLGEYQAEMASRNYFLHDEMPDDFLDQLVSAFEKRNADKSVDLNIPYLQLSRNAFAKKDTTKGIAYFQHIQPGKLLNIFQYNDFFCQSYTMEFMGELMASLAVSNRYEQAYSLISAFKKEVNRSTFYGYASQMAMLHHQSSAAAQRLADSARAEMIRYEKPDAFQPNRHQLAIALMYINPRKNSREAKRVIKNLFNKLDALGRFSRAHAWHGQLYEARQMVPTIFSTLDESFFLFETIEGLNFSKPLPAQWKKFRSNDDMFLRRFLFYINEND